MKHSPTLSSWHTIITVAIVTCAVQFACLTFWDGRGFASEARAAAEPKPQQGMFQSGSVQLIPVCQKMVEILERMDQRLERIEKVVVAASGQSGQPNAASR